MYENFDLNNIVTPVNAEKFRQLPVDTNYNKDETDFVYQGFKYGFSLEYTGDPFVKIKAPNLKFRRVGNRTVLWNKVKKEVKAKRFAWIFWNHPFWIFYTITNWFGSERWREGYQADFSLVLPQEDG